MVDYSDVRVAKIEKSLGDRCGMRCVEKAGDLIQGIANLDEWMYIAEHSDQPHHVQIMSNQRGYGLMLADEIADLYVALATVIKHYELDEKRILERIDLKLN